MMRERYPERLKPDDLTNFTDFLRCVCHVRLKIPVGGDAFAQGGFFGSFLCFRRLWGVVFIFALGLQVVGNSSPVSIFDKFFFALSLSPW